MLKNVEESYEDKIYHEEKILKYHRDYFQADLQIRKNYVLIDKNKRAFNLQSAKLNYSK